MINYTYLFEYYPETVIDVSERQRQDRLMVQDFMMGEVSERLLSILLDEIKRVVGQKAIDIVCFIPGSTGSKTLLRYGNLATHMVEKLGCDVSIDAVSLQFDADPITHEMKYKCNAKRLEKKNILLVGCVYNTGKTLDIMENLLKDCRVKSVEALFVAKAVNRNS